MPINELSKFCHFCAWCINISVTRIKRILTFSSTGKEVCSFYTHITKYIKNQEVLFQSSHLKGWCVSDVQQVD
jgi:hypothetical protein